MDKQLIIYYDHKFKCFQVVKPCKLFNGNWRELAETIAGIDLETGQSKAYRWVVK